MTTQQKHTKQLRLKSGIQAGKGLGDIVADFTHATRLDRLSAAYERLTGKSCGCDARQRALNRIDLPI